MTPSHHLDSHDIYLCAFLLAQGAQLVGVEREGHRTRFGISLPDDLDTAVEAYWSNVPVPVVPAQLFASLKHLKSLLHSGG